MKIEKTRRFLQTVKKLHSNQKSDLDKVVRMLIKVALNNRQLFFTG